MKSIFTATLVLIVFIFQSACMTAQKSNHLKLGNEFAKDGLYREAVASYKKELKVNSDNHHARRNLGVVYVKLGLYTKAIKHLEKSIQHLSKNYQSNYYLAEAYRATNKFDKAIYRYKTSLQIRPKDYAATKALSWSYYKIKYYSAAMSSINSLPKSDRNNPQSIIIKSRILMKQKRTGAAKKLISRLHNSKNPNFIPFAKSVLGDIHLEEGELQHAKTIYKDALKTKPYLAGALLGLGKIYNIEGDKRQASILLERAIKIRPSLNEAYLELAKAYENRNTKKSLSYYRAFNKRSKNDPEFSNSIPFTRKKIISLTKTLNNKTHKNQISRKQPNQNKKTRSFNQAKKANKRKNPRTIQR